MKPEKLELILYLRSLARAASDHFTVAFYTTGGTREYHVGVALGSLKIMASVADDLRALKPTEEDEPK